MSCHLTIQTLPQLIRQHVQVSVRLRRSVSSRRFLWFLFPRLQPTSFRGILLDFGPVRRFDRLERRIARTVIYRVAGIEVRLNLVAGGVKFEACLFADETDPPPGFSGVLCALPVALGRRGERTPGS